MPRSRSLTLALHVVVPATLLLPSGTSRADESTAAEVETEAKVSPVDALLAPSAVGSTVILPQRSVGVDLVAAVRYRALRELVGSEVDARFSASRRDGAFSWIATGLIHRALGTRDDVDAQASVTALFTVHSVHLGAEGRARGELVEGVVAADDFGRPVEIIAGGVAGVTEGATTVQALGGFCWPRGLAAPGPMILAGASFAF